MLGQIVDIERLPFAPAFFTPTINNGVTTNEENNGIR